MKDGMLSIRAAASSPMGIWFGRDSVRGFFCGAFLGNMSHNPIHDKEGNVNNIYLKLKKACYHNAAHIMRTGLPLVFGSGGIL